jgi:hypothetical protein
MLPISLLRKFRYDEGNEKRTISDLGLLAGLSYADRSIGMCHA